MASHMVMHAFAAIRFSVGSASLSRIVAMPMLMRMRMRMVILEVTRTVAKPGACANASVVDKTMLT